MLSSLGIEVVGLIPDQFALHPAYPNPFNPTTSLAYDLPEAGYVSVIVYDLIGREISRLVDRNMNPGYHKIIWNGRDRIGSQVPSGIYIARIVTPGFSKSIKLVLMR